MGSRNNGGRDPNGKGQFWGLPDSLTSIAVVYAAKEIILSPITARSRRDNSRHDMRCGLSSEFFDHPL